MWTPEERVIVEPGLEFTGCCGVAAVAVVIEGLIREISYI
jgi:hypothetical protein